MNQEQRNQIAARVRAEMERQGLDNPRLAQRAGVAEKTVSRVINARTDPRYGTLERIAKALKLDLCELSGTPPPPLGLGAAPDPFSSNGSPPGPREIAVQIAALMELIKDLDARLQEFRGDTAGAFVGVMRRLDDIDPPSEESRPRKRA